MGNLHETNKKYFDTIDSIISTYKDYRVFLMTDDLYLLKAFLGRYGEKIVYTDCLRTDSSTGVHYQNIADRHRLGVEIMIDTYLAIKGDIFIGNSRSNPSCMILYLKKWNKNDIHLFGPNMHHTYNTFLHNW